MTVSRVGDGAPTTVRMVVVFPAPFGPRNPNTSPASTSNDSDSTPTTSP